MIWLYDSAWFLCSDNRRPILHINEKECLMAPVKITGYPRLYFLMTNANEYRSIFSNNIIVWSNSKENYYFSINNIRSKQKWNHNDQFAKCKHEYAKFDWEWGVPPKKKASRTPPVPSSVVPSSSMLFLLINRSLMSPSISPQIRGARSRPQPRQTNAH